jgi:hypothetical protein
MVRSNRNGGYADRRRTETANRPHRGLSLYDIFFTWLSRLNFTISFITLLLACFIPIPPTESVADPCQHELIPSRLAERNSVRTLEPAIGRLGHRLNASGEAGGEIESNFI